MNQVSDTDMIGKVQALRGTAGPRYNIEGYSEWNALPGGCNDRRMRLRSSQLYDFGLC